MVNRARPHILGGNSHLDDTVHGIHVADSFTDFLHRYLNDPDSLFGFRGA